MTLCTCSRLQPSHSERFYDKILYVLPIIIRGFSGEIDSMATKNINRASEATLSAKEGTERANTITQRVNHARDKNVQLVRITTPGKGCFPPTPWLIPSTTQWSKQLTHLTKLALPYKTLRQFQVWLTCWVTMFCSSVADSFSSGLVDKLTYSQLPVLLKKPFVIVDEMQIILS